MPRITAVQDRLQLNMAEVKAYLRVEHDEEDALLEELVKAVKTSADSYLNNPFTGASGAEEPIPDDVKVWVLRRVAYLYEQRLENVSGDTLAGVGEVDYGKVSSFDYTLFRPYRLNPGL